MRRADGQHDPRSSGTLVDANGKTTHLADKDFTLTPGRATFKSKNGAVYPTEWTVSIPSHNASSCTVTTPLNDQELSLVQSTGIAYWEGMIDVAGQVRRSGSQGVRLSRDDGLSRQPGTGAVGISEVLTGLRATGLRA